MRHLLRLIGASALLTLLLAVGLPGDAAINDTGQTTCYDVDGTGIACPEPGSALFGQDGSYISAPFSFTDNGDGTVTDNNTGLMWQQDPGDKVTFAAALDAAPGFSLAGYNDWRVPSIKELYSLIDFSGVTGMTIEASVPYIDTDYFVFEYGDESAGERIIDAQFWSSTQYVSTTMNGDATVFGVNFADGRIKGYPIRSQSGENTLFVRYVRGDAYGVNDLVDNGNGTITDNSTSLVWTQDDSGGFGAGQNGTGGLNWPGALAFCEGLSFAGADDWRLPNAHELQMIVDYTRSPATTNSAAIDPIFNATPIIDEGGGVNFAFYWTGTTHLDGATPGNYAAYVAFGQALGFMTGPEGGSATLMDVHGAGSQRSDPKTGDPADWPQGNGPQGDVIRIYNMVRCVRGGDVTVFSGGPVVDTPTNNQPPQQQDTQQQQGQQPPEAAINACSGSGAGAACSFQTPQGGISGTCQDLQGTLACVPAGGPGG